MMTKTYNAILSNEQLDLIKQKINEQLKVRCFDVEITIVEEKSMIKLSSTTFQTVPVLHTNLSITNFGGCIFVNDNDIIVYVPVHVTYDGNGVTLFNLRISLLKNDNYFIGVDIQ